MWLPHVCGGVTMHVRTCTPHFYISGTAEPIAPKFGMYVPSGQLVKWLPHINGGVTIARAHVHTLDTTYISRERLNRLR